jgi:hypothetical protein
MGLAEERKRAWRASVEKQCQLILQNRNGGLATDIATQNQNARVRTSESVHQRGAGRVLVRIASRKMAREKNENELSAAPLAPRSMRSGAGAMNTGARAACAVRRVAECAELNTMCMPVPGRSL